MKFLLPLALILSFGLTASADDGGMTCSSQSIMPGGCDMPSRTAASKASNEVVLSIPKIHCESCASNIGKIIGKLKLPDGVTNAVSVENKAVTIGFAEGISKSSKEEYTNKITKALNKKGYKVKK